MSRNKLQMAKKPERRRDPAPASLAARLFGEGVAHHQAGRVSEAEARYRQVITLKPDHAESCSNLALALIMKGSYAEAVEASELALGIRADYLEAHLNLATAFEALRVYDKAIEVYKRAVALAPDRDALWSNLGVNYDRLGQYENAVIAYRQALALKPDNADAQFNLARALNTLGRGEESIVEYQRLIAIQPGQAAAYSNLGTLLCAYSRYDEAADVGFKAIALAPENPEVFCNLGVILQRRGNLSEAVLAYRRAIELKPDYAIVYGNLGVAYQELFKFDDAVAALTQAVALKPDFDTGLIELVKMRRHVCDWSRYDADWAYLCDLVEKNLDNMFMLLLMAFPSTPAQQLACAYQSMTRLRAIPRRFETYVVETNAAAKIRVGYISNDFRDHPVGRLLPDFFARHDRSRFEIFGYALGNDDSGLLRKRIRSGCDHFIDLHHMSNAAAADRIHADAIDILVDLTGPTVGARLEILADRPAPVQVSFIGWPGTMGLPYMDYIIADPFLVPFELQPHYSEKIVHLPDCYQPSDPQRTAVKPALTRKDCGLPDDAFVFCSFNNTVKITPEMFDLWMRLLNRVENSLLWLYCKSEATIANLRQRAAAHGVPADRIVFAALAPMDVYLGRLTVADLFLDSTPYNAGATCNDALWMGLPVLTCVGETYVSRMAGSLLNAIGLEDLITTSLEDYEKRAIELAKNPSELKALRARLIANRDVTPLFDMAAFTRHLEAAYSTMREITRAEEAPRPFAVERIADPAVLPAA